MIVKKPTAFRIFIIVIFISIIVFTTATFFSYYKVDKKYAMLLAFFQFVAFAFTTIGIYTGIKFKTEEKKLRIFNRIGLIGNTLIFLFVLGIMLTAALVKAGS